MHSRSRSPSPDEILLLSRPPPPKAGQDHHHHHHHHHRSAAGGGGGGGGGDFSPNSSSPGAAAATVQSLMAMETSGFSEFGPMGTNAADLDEQAMLQRQAVEESFLTSNPAALLEVSASSAGGGNYDPRMNLSSGAAAGNVSGAGSPINVHRGPRFGIERVEPVNDDSTVSLAAGAVGDDGARRRGSSCVSFRPAVLTAFEIQQRMREEQEELQEQAQQEQQQQQQSPEMSPPKPPTTTTRAYDLPSVENAACTSQQPHGGRSTASHSTNATDVSPSHLYGPGRHPAATAGSAALMREEEAQMDVSRKLHLVDRTLQEVFGGGNNIAEMTSPSPIHPSSSSSAAFAAEPVSERTSPNQQRNAHHILAEAARSALGVSSRSNSASASPVDSNHHHHNLRLSPQQQDQHRSSSRRPPPSSVASVASLSSQHRDRFWSNDIIASSRAFSTDDDESSGGSGKMTFQRYMAEHFDETKMSSDDAAFFKSLAQKMNVYEKSRAQNPPRSLHPQHATIGNTRHSSPPRPTSYRIGSENSAPALPPAPPASVFSSVGEVHKSLRIAREQLAMAQSAAEKKSQTFEEDQRRNQREMANFPSTAAFILKERKENFASGGGAGGRGGGGGKSNDVADSGRKRNNEVSAVRDAVEKAFKSFRSQQRKEDSEKMQQLEEEIQRRREERELTRRKEEGQEQQKQQERLLRRNNSIASHQSSKRYDSPRSDNDGDDVFGSRHGSSFSPSPRRRPGETLSERRTKRALSEQQEQQQQQQRKVFSNLPSFSAEKTWEVSNRQTQMPQLAAELRHDQRRFRGSLSTPSYQEAFTQQQQRPRR